MPRKPTGASALKKSAVTAAPRPPTAIVATPGPGKPETTIAMSGDRGGTSFRARLATIIAVVGLLSLHYASSLLAVCSRKTPRSMRWCICRRVSLYWQKGTFRLYHHNPPLVKLVAALPVMWANPLTAPVYALPSWKNEPPDQTTFSQSFAHFNIPRYFELFQLAGLMMPLFSLSEGLQSLPGRAGDGIWGGLLSLSLWVFCPNILASCRLITSDLGSTALGVSATYVFWRYLHQPRWRWAAAAGVMLGLTQLTKFSMVLLYAVWPFLWLVRRILRDPGKRAVGRHVAGYGPWPGDRGLELSDHRRGLFLRGRGDPARSVRVWLEVVDSTGHARHVPPGQQEHPAHGDLAVPRQSAARDLAGQGSVPVARALCPGLRRAEDRDRGNSPRFSKAVSSPRPGGPRSHGRSGTGGSGISLREKRRYPVYLNGELQRTGWWYYYLLALAYKVPEGTWLLVILSLASFRFVRRSRAEWADEVSLWTVPLVILFSMSFLTDINLGLRYVLAIAPYVFVATGKLVPWTLGLSGARKRVMTSLVAGSLVSTIASSFWIYPNYLAYFNWASGGPDRARHG